MRTNKELRAAGREALRGNWLMAICVLLVQSLILSVTSSFGLNLFVAGPLSAGVAFAFMRRVRDGAAIDVADMFRPFSGKALELSFLAGLLANLLISLGYLLIVPGIILTYSFRLVPYLAAEREDLTATECLRESRRLMRGYKWRAFCLDFSFVGWFLLGFLVCGFGVIFVTPYFSAAGAAFALDRMRADAVTDAPIDPVDPIDEETKSES